MTSFVSLLTSQLAQTGRQRGSLVALPPGVRINQLGGVKQVRKPWGFELWLADGSNGSYAFKIIYLRQGTKTSLQYHQQKVEHNCLLEGKIRLHIQTPGSEGVTADLEAVHVIAIDPPTVHRIEALTDVVLVEASTAQVDDVIRVADDYQRSDGKIASEHGL